LFGKHIVIQQLGYFILLCKSNNKSSIANGFRYIPTLIVALLNKNDEEVKETYSNKYHTPLQIVSLLNFVHQ